MKELEIFILCLCPYFAFGVIQGDVDGRHFSKEDEQKILDMHNMYRARVANGKESGQPQAADMVAMEWDDRLQRSAQRWSDGCRAGHNSYDARKFNPYVNVGQCFTYNYGLEKSMEVWYEEVKPGKPGYSFGGRIGGAGHYTQLIWGSTTKVGCGYTKCNNEAMVVCDYAPGANSNWKGKDDPPYKRGSPCSQCPVGYGYCMGRVLCASHRACQNTESDCKCLVKRCVNGKMDRGKCYCKCNDGYTGLECDKKCENKGGCPTASKWQPERQIQDEYCKWDSNWWMWMSHDCHETCQRYCRPLDNLGGDQNRNRHKVNVKKVKLFGALGKRKRGNCRNDHKDCDMWAGNGQCEANPGYMHRSCAGSCNTCAKRGGRK